MIDIKKFMDPLELMMKLRDSMTNGDPAHFQNYLSDVVIKALNERKQAYSGPVGVPGNTSDRAEIMRQLQVPLNQSLLQMGQLPGMGDNQHLQNYIRSVMEQALNQSFGQAGTEAASPVDNRDVTIQSSQGVEKDAGVFETHDNVIIRLRVPARIDKRMIRLKVGTDKVRLQRAPGSSESIIRLPADVRNEDASAVIKNGILEITVPKESNPNLKEIRVD